MQMRKWRLGSAVKRTIALLVACMMLPVQLWGTADAGAKTEVLSAGGPQRPFPQHVTYASGTIKPNHVTQAAMDKEVALLYDEWKKKYLKQNKYAADQYYVWYNDGGWNGEAITVSEAHGYGMMITALMAGHDPNAKKLFDGMYRYFRAHPSEINKDLMAWQQSDTNDAIIDSNGANSAIDGDMDIAYALLLADKQWGSNGAINYLAEGKKVINAIMKSEVHPTEYHLQLGDWVQAYDSDPDYKRATRPSDFMLQHMKDFQAATGDARWGKVVDNTYGIIQQVHKNFSPKTGLLPDFLYKDETDGQFKPVSYRKWNTDDGNFLESELDGEYNYNSCRTPWRIATDYLVTGDKRAKAQLSAMNAFIRSNHDTPGSIWSGYKLDGSERLSEWEGGLDFTAPFMVSAMIDASNQQWLNDMWDYHTDAANPTAQEWKYYYGNTIRLLSMIVVSGNWWSPSATAAGSAVS